MMMRMMLYERTKTKTNKKRMMEEKTIRIFTGRMAFFARLACG